MAELSKAYDTIVEAERVLIEDGYKRDVGRALWVHSDYAPVKVIRTPGNKFMISRK